MLRNEIVVAGRAWIPRAVLTDRQLKRIRKNTTVRLKPGPYDDGPTVIKMVEETDFQIGLPRGFWERTSRGSGGLPIVYDVTETPRTIIPALYPRDDLQREGYETLRNRLREKRVTGALLCSATGTGKTVMGLLVAGSLGMTVLVVVHTTALMNQWVERILEDPGVFPDARVGIFKGDVEEFGDDYDIVIAMVQTLSNCEDGHPIFEWAGLLVVDEVHRLGAPTWNLVAHRFTAAKRLGLTATPRRRDGGEQLFFDTIGEIAFESKVPMLVPRVRKRTTTFTFDKEFPSWVEDQVLLRDRERNAYIVREVALARKAGRHILMLTKRVEHAMRLKSLISAQVSGTSIGLCIGSWYVDEVDALSWSEHGRKYQDALKSGGKYDPDLIDTSIHKVKWKDKEKGTIAKVLPKTKPVPIESFMEATKADIIIATYKMVEEGFDVPRLDTLMLTMPIWDPVQSTGRILRIKDGKKEPIVVHFVDERVTKYRNAWHACRRHYKDLGADV